MGNLFSYAFGQLMFSSSYLTAPSFGCMCGLLLYIYSKRQNGKDTDCA